MNAITKPGRRGLHGLFLLLSVTIFLSIGCTAEPLELRYPWQDGELAVMEIKQGGKLVLVNEVEVKQVQDELLFSTEYLLIDYPQMRRIYLDPATLMPRHTEYEMTTAGGVKYLRAEYGEKQVVITKDTDDGTVEDKVRLPAAPYFDNDQFLLLVRALPLEEGWQGSVNLIVTPTAQRVAIGLAVTGRETVTVPAGTFDTFVVELKRANQWAWVSADPPYPVVKFENRNADTVSELVEFYPTGRE